VPPCQGGRRGFESLLPLEESDFESAGSYHFSYHRRVDRRCAAPAKRGPATCQADVRLSAKARFGRASRVDAIIRKRGPAILDGAGASSRFLGKERATVDRAIALSAGDPPRFTMIGSTSDRLHGVEARRDAGDERRGTEGWVDLAARRRGLACLTCRRAAGAQVFNGSGRARRAPSTSQARA